MLGEPIPLSLKFITGFSIAGFLFSGYLSVVKLFSNTCAVQGGCPFFLGLPACYFGFVIYVALVALSVAAIRRRMPFHGALIAIIAVALLGILFAGYLTFTEFSAFIKTGFSGAFGVPTCLIGLMFYMIILGTAALGLAHHRTHQ